MFIAHMPAGFLLSRHILRKQRDESYYISFLLAGMIASVSPDFDLAYFHLIDDRQHPHHSYWTHIPVFWLAIYAAIYFPILKWFGEKAGRLLTIILLGGLLHMGLDSFASGIKWLYPFDTRYHGLWRVPAIHDWWVANYLFHWTFLLELVITFTAAIVWFRDQALRSEIRLQLQSWLYMLLPGNRLLTRFVAYKKASSQE